MNDRNADAIRIFSEAIGIEDVASRQRFLDDQCDDTEVRRVVDELIEAGQRANSFLDAPIVQRRVTHETIASKIEKVGQNIGRYRLLQQIGEGGFGVVYMAEQKRPVRRKVALKIIKPGMDTRDVIARFEAERQALALMDHPNIAKVIDAGATDNGRPYFVMELVKGVPIIEFCNANKLTNTQRLKLFTTVCKAIQHAHQKGIIHRDVKPSNVMVTINDGVPMPKVIDFGVAKAINQELTEHTLFTAYGQMIGTPQYMSPEQAQISAMDVDTRSDVYSLGVLLYELLTDSTPLEAARLRATGFDEMRRIIREEDPPKPSMRLSTMGDQLSIVADNRGMDSLGVQRSVNSELDWIVMRALDKDRSRRYQSALEFADDVHRHLVGEAVEACPPTYGYLVSKLVSRYRLQVVVAATFVGVVTLSAIVTCILYLDARKARDLAHESKAQTIVAKREVENQRDRAERNFQESENRRHENETLALELKRRLYSDNLSRSLTAAEKKDAGAALSYLDQCLEEQRGWEWHYLRAAIPLERRVVWSDTEAVCIKASPTEEKLAMTDNIGMLRMKRLSDGRELWSVKLPFRVGYRVEFTRDGHYVGVGSLFTNKVSGICVFEVATGKLVISQTSDDHFGGFGDFSPDGKKLAYPKFRFEDGKLKGYAVLWDLEKNQEVWTRPCPGCPNLQFSVDGTRLYLNCVRGTSTDRPSKLLCWETSTAREIWRQDRDFSSFVVATPDGTKLVTGDDSRLEIRNALTGKVVEEYPQPFVVGCFDSGGRYLLTYSKSLAVFDWHSRSQKLVIGARQDINFGATFTADGEYVLTTNAGSRAIDFYRTNHSTRLVASGHHRFVNSLCFSADGGKLFSSSQDGTIRLWDSKTGQELKAWRSGAPRALRCSPVDDLLVVSVDGGESPSWLEIRNTNTWQLVHKWTKEWEQGPASWCDFSDDGQKLIVGGRSKSLVVYDVTNGRVLRHEKMSDEIQGVVFLDGNGDKAAVLSPRQEIAVWDTTTGDHISIVDRDAKMRSRSLDVTPDGRFLLTCAGRRIELWDNNSHSLVRSFEGHQSRVSFVKSDVSGKRIFSTDDVGVVKVWDLDTGDALLTLHAYEDTRYPGSYASMALSPDGKTLAVAGQNGTIKVWSSERPTVEVYRQRRFVMAATQIVDECMDQVTSMRDLVSQISQSEKLDDASLAIALQIANGRKELFSTDVSRD